MPGYTFLDLARSIDNILTGGFRWPKRTVTAAGSTAISSLSDTVVEFDATAGAQTPTLPDATQNTGMAFFLKKIDASANAVVVSCAVGGQLIDDEVSFSLATKNSFLIVISNGTGYYIYAKIVNPAYVFTSPDELTIDAADNELIPWVPGRGTSVSRATAQVKTAPTGASVIITVKVITRSTGATVATLTNALTIAATELEGSITFTPRVIAETEALAAEITQIGSTLPGANLTVLVD